VTGQQNWIFILKTLFPQKMSDVSFTKPTSTVGLQLLNLGLLSVMLRFIDDGVTAIKPCHTTTETHDVVRWVVLHSVPYIRKSLRLQNTKGSLQSRMFGFQQLNMGEVLWWFGQQYHGTVFCWFCYYPSWWNYCNGVPGHEWVG
jgi:hypothetical protein